MKKLFNLLTLVAAALAVIGTATTAQAQLDGYRFGVGIDYANYRAFGRHQFRADRFGAAFAPAPRIDQPPFFALYPPVYYDRTIVARPYGVSPYAVPPGIAPVEMSVPTPLRQENPYFVEPKKDKDSDDKSSGSTDSKTTWMHNPYFNGQSVAQQSGDTNELVSITRQ